tara:strand:- start:608 stop:919 length:312 start_codon:yes stop_codon:yes gene_type:complete
MAKKYDKVVIKTSSNPKKKLDAVFSNSSGGRTKTVSFGSKNMDDYTKTKDKAQRSRYRSRHRKDLSTGDPTRAGYLSWHILWGSSTSRRENIASYKRKFGFNS